MNIFFDIETLPCQMPGIREEFAAAVTAPAQYKKPESIAEWMRENREAEAEKSWLATSFDGALGQVCVIGFAIGDDEPTAFAVEDLSGEEEVKLLEDFFAMLRGMHSTHGTRPVLIGHNSNGFDIPFLWKRAIVRGVPPPLWFPRDPKPWGDATFDTMLQWYGSGQKAGGSMERLCRALGIPGKGDISGADVWPMVRDGQIKQVAEYCIGDVRRTRDIYRRITFHRR